MRRWLALILGLLLMCSMVQTSATAAPTNRPPAPGRPASTVLPSAAAPVAAPGSYQPVKLVRMFNSAAAGALTPGKPRKVAIGGRNGIPAGASAIRVNVTAQLPSRAGSLSVYPGTSAFNGMATMSFGAGVTEQRMIIANLGTDGTVALRNNGSASLNVILDVIGYFAGGTPTALGGYTPVPAVRIFNTVPHGGIGTNKSANVSTRGKGAIPDFQVGPAEVIVNFTLLSPSHRGTIVVLTSQHENFLPINFHPGSSTQFMAAVTLQTPDDIFQINNNSVGVVNVLADVVGYVRGVDASGAVGTVGGVLGQPYGHVVRIAARHTFTFQPTATVGGIPADLPANGVATTTLSMVVLASTAAGSVTIQPADEPVTGVVTASFRAGMDQSYAGSVRLSAAGKFTVRNNAAVPVVVQIQYGEYTNGPANPFGFAGYDTVFPDGGSIEAISCASATFCVATERGGKVREFDGQKWSGPTSLPAPGPVYEVACPAVTRCFAVGETTMEYDGKSWTNVARGFLERTRLSCADTDLCIMTAANYWMRWDGTSWSPLSAEARLTSTPTDSVTSLSCPSPAFCLAVINNNESVTFDGTSWSTPNRVLPAGSTDAITSIACSTASACVAVTKLGQTAALGSSGWSALSTPAGPASDFVAVGCPTGGRCVALDTDGYARSLDGTVWSTRFRAGAFTPVGLSCVGESDCVAVGDHAPGDVDYRAYSASYDGDTWSASVSIDQASGPLAGLACVTSTFCIAVSHGGAAASFDGTSWSEQAQVDPSDGLTDVGCSSATWCVAVTGGKVLNYRNGTWSDPAEIDARHALTAVACSSTGLCVAGDHDGRLLTYVDGAWRSPTAWSSTSVAALSCGRDGTCMAMDQRGAAARVTSAGFQRLVHSPLTAVSGLSCVSADYCQATDAAGQSAAWAGSWSVVPGGYAAVGCAAVAECESYGDNVFIAWDGHFGSRPTTSIYEPAAVARLVCPDPTECFASDGARSVTRLRSVVPAG